MKKQPIILASILLILSAFLLSSCASSSSVTSSVSWPGIASDGETVYAASGQFIYAIKDGNLVWQYPAAADRKITYYAAPAVSDDRVFAATYSNKINILKKDSGELIQTVAVGSDSIKIIASPVIDGDKLIVASGDGTITLYKMDDFSAPVWTAKLSGEIWTNPVSADGKIFAAAMDKKINELDMATGEIIKTWSTDGASMSGIVYANKMIYFSTLSKEVIALDPQSGELKILFKTDSEIWASPLALEDRIIIGDMSGAIYCHDILNGGELWKINAPAENKSAFVASPMEFSDKTFAMITEAGDISIYDTAGKSVQDRSAKYRILSTPVMAGGNIVTAFVEGDNLLTAFDSGLKEQWSYAAKTVSKSSGTAQNSTSAVTEAPTAENTAAVADQPTSEGTSAVSATAESKGE